MSGSNIETKSMLSKIEDAYFRIRMRFSHARKMFYAKEHFYAQTDAHKAALLFKQSVRFINLEVSSYCNRVCSYCPNARIDRRSEHKYIRDEVFHNVLRQLASINYNKVICLHLYNEPLEDREYFINRLKQVKAYLPKSKFEVYTNGDYLNNDYVRELYASGCARIHATAHNNWDTYCPDKAKAYLFKLIEKLGFEYTVTKDTPTDTLCEVHVGEGMLFTYHILDFLGDDENGISHALDRAQSLDIPLEYSRVSPCLRQFEEVFIDYTGKFTPCSHIRGDVPEQAQHVMAEIGSDDDLFLLWCNDNHASWRRKNMSYEVKEPPCTTCHYKTIGEDKRLLKWSEYLKSEGAPE